MTMAAGLVAEVHCLNCARILAQAVCHERDGAIEIQPAAHRNEVQVIADGPRRLRCRYCGGRAYVDAFRPLDRRGALRSWPAPVRPRRP
jgi:hypothetical protein